jgi:hypothetical protein
MADQNATRPVPPRDASPEGRNRRIPPLVWIVLLLLIGWFVVAMLQFGGTDRSPHGGTVPRAAESTGYMPATPPQGSAPATPAGAVNGPLEPAGSNAPK